jgi:hypothetical protein
MALADALEHSWLSQDSCHAKFDFGGRSRHPRLTNLHRDQKYRRVRSTGRLDTVAECAQEQRVLVEDGDNGDLHSDTTAVESITDEDTISPFPKAKRARRSSWCSEDAFPKWATREKRVKGKVVHSGGV